MQRILFFVVFILFGCTHYNSTEYIGADFLGAPYVKNPLGEGVLPDIDPLIRFDAFDCVTFVETALADGDIDKLNNIRYKNGKPNFINRNHFIETDWLQNNSNLFTNVSTKYAPTKIRNVTINKKAWFKKVHNIDTNFAPQNAALEYIPYADVRDIKVTKPVIVLFIIKSKKTNDKIGTDLAVRHMGFLLPDGRLRHASRREKRVVDTDFNKYINRMVENQNNLGIMLLEIKK